MDSESQETRHARHRASIKWLLSKAFYNCVPDNLKEPYYSDHDNQERIKPQIIVEMGNATLYCQTLSNLYSDPNYQNMNHWSIIQTLARKGVPVAEIPGMQISETVLMQTNPLRINAHISVVESLMMLYAREMTSADRIPNAIKRISGSPYQSQTGQTFEKSLLAWIAHACAALKRRIVKELETENVDTNGDRIQAPDIPPVRDFQDLCDGVCLALLISYYCPKIVHWKSIKINYLPAVDDSIHNVLLVHNFSETHLPYSVFHMTPEDITYMRGSMKVNLIVLLADLFNLFEVHPAKCVTYPELETKGTVLAHKSMPSSEYLNVKSAEYELSSGQEASSSKGYVVHKSRGVKTLSSMHTQDINTQQEALVPARLRTAKEKNNLETKADERGEYVPAGKPSNWEYNRRPSYAGRRSRRNSSSEDSQLTIENFGGSQDQLNKIGRICDQERERKLSNTSIVEPAVAVRSSIVDARGTLQLGYDTDSGSEKQDRETEKYSMRRPESTENIAVHASNSHLNNVSNSSGVLTSAKAHSIHKDDFNDVYSERPMQSNSQIDSTLSEFATDSELTVKRRSSNASTTNAWYQNMIVNPTDPNDDDDDETRSLKDVSKLSTIRSKLEEKRRRIEQEKYMIEMAISQHQEKDDKESSLDLVPWETVNNDSKRNSDINTIELDKYKQRVAMMNLNLQDIQQDIQRLKTHQNQIQAQHLQSKQLMQAQQIANILQQQPYGSQQHIAAHYNQRGSQPQHFGSTPHLPQVFNSAYNISSSRPPSRDSYQQHMHLQNIESINEHGQYINQQSQPQPPSMIPQSHINMPPQAIYNENGPQLSYSGHAFGGGGYQFQLEPNSHYHSPPQRPHQQYMSRPQDYDDYPPPQRGRDPNAMHNTYYLHESSPQSQQAQRRTWVQSAQEQQQFQQHQPMVDVNAWQSHNPPSKIETNGTWSKESPQSRFLIQNGGGYNNELYQNLFPVQQIKHQPLQQHLITNFKETISPNNVKATHATTLIPSDDMMAPQSICFIGDEEDVDEIERNIIETMQSTRLSDYHKNDFMLQNFNQMRQKSHSERGSSSEDNDNDLIARKINITSGNLTYRIPSPTRPSLKNNSFQNPYEDTGPNKKGFYISFDNDQPKRPKPPLRTKRSPKNEKDDVDNVMKRDVRQINNKIVNNDRVTESNKFENSNATYNKYTDSPIQLRQLSEIKNQILQPNNSMNTMERRHLEDVPTQQSPTQQLHFAVTRQQSTEPKGKALVIDADTATLDPESVDEMEKRKEKLMLLSLQRRQQQEEAKARKEIEANLRREREREKEDERVRKKEEQVAKRAAILEQHRLKKAIEEAEREGKTHERTDMHRMQHSQNSTAPRLRTQKVIRPRPKTIHVDAGSSDINEASSIYNREKKSSRTNLTEPSAERGRTLSRISVAKGSTLNLRGRKSNSLMNLCDTDSGLGRATPPRRAPSPGIVMSGRHMPSPTGPGSLPPGLVSKCRDFDDGSSDVSSTPNSMLEYSGPKLYKQPAAKSNRGIILNAVEYCVFPGAVNRDAKQKVLEKIARSEAKHFLVLFRDAGCQFRALYSYVPETDHIFKLYGTGPSQVVEVMFDKFFKYNSGGKCFSQVHTKHLTVTIDAFTIHNSLWQGKKVHLPSKKDMALVI